MNCTYPFDLYISFQVFAFVSFLIMIAFYLYMIKLDLNKYARFSLVCVMVGGFSNILPRALGKCVFDYIPFFIWRINIGDILVVVGIMVLALNIWIKKSK